MKKFRLFICSIGAIFVLTLGISANAAHLFPTPEEMMIRQTSCVQPMPCADAELFSTDEETQKPLTHQKLLTILIEFEDVKMHFTSNYWNGQIFSKKPNDISVVNYWKENSNGLDIFEPADTSGVQIGRKGKVSYKDYIDLSYEITERADGIVKVSLDMPHPIKTWGNGGVFTDNGEAPLKTITSAVWAIEADFDFAVEQPHILTIFAGYDITAPDGAGKGEMWAHASAVDIKTSTGINLGRYATQGELYEEDISCGIGVTCHELGHSVFYLPDLYTHIGESGMYVYSLMSGGSHGYRYVETINDDGSSYMTCLHNVPTHLDPWCKIKCGFVDPEVVNEWDGNINSISNMGVDSKYNVIKVRSKADPKQYFLIENRQIIGFDEALKSLNALKGSEETPFNGGILIYHIDENVDCVNNNSNLNNHRFISAESSNSAIAVSDSSYGWPYLNIDGRNKLNADTIPNSNFHEADNLKICSYEEDCHPQTVKSGISIEVLGENSPSMRVKVNVDDEYKITETDETFSDVFKDINFCNAIIEILSEDGKERKANDIISEDDWFKILSIEILTISDRDIRSLAGIEHLSKLTDITCSNNELTELDFSNNPELNYIDCKNNKLVKLNISQCKNLMFLYCRDNALQELNIRSNTALTQLNCINNELKKLDVTQNTKLNRLLCNDNYMDEDYKEGIIGIESLKNSLIASENNFKYLPQKTLGETPSPTPTPTVEPSPTPTVEPSPTPTVELSDRIEFEQSGDTVSAKLIFEKTAPPAENNIMLIVSYRENGQLKRVEVPEISDMTASFDYKDCDIAVYVWDKNMKPLMEVQKFALKENKGENNGKSIC